MKKAIIKNEIEVCCNIELINIGYSQEYACTIGELKEFIKDFPDSSLVYFKGKVDPDASFEDSSEMWVMECEVETEEEYQNRIAAIEEKKKQDKIDKENREKTNKLLQFNKLKAELGL